MDSANDNLAEREMREAMWQEYPGKTVSNAGEAAMVSAGYGGNAFKSPPVVYKTIWINKETKEVVSYEEVQKSKAQENAIGNMNQKFAEDEAGKALVTPGLEIYEENEVVQDLYNQRAMDKIAMEGGDLSIQNIENQALILWLSDYLLAQMQDPESVKATFWGGVNVAMSTLAGEGSAILENVFVKAPLFIPSLLEKGILRTNYYEQLVHEIDYSIENEFVSMGADRTCFQFGERGGNFVTAVAGMTQLAMGIANLPKTLQSMQFSFGSSWVNQNGALAFAPQVVSVMVPTAATVNDAAQSLYYASVMDAGMTGAGQNDSVSGPSNNQAPTVKYNDKDVNVYRGGNNFNVRTNDIRIDANGNVSSDYGISVNVNPNSVTKIGNPYKIESLPDGLTIIQRGMRPEHFEIVASYPMSIAKYQALLNQIVVVPV
ncbi:MAG: hypothetical protein PHP22_08465 [Oscillospiraceae bacterium]|nr:hypothetical protein [Oscillospiraceae bacterium]